MKLILVIPIILVTRYVTVFGNHLPEDKRDDGVELVREKRDNFIDRILKSIPFFHMASPSNVLEEEQVEPFNDDDDDAADDDDDDEPNMTLSPPQVSTTVSTLPSFVSASASSSMVLSATVPATPTAYSDQSSFSVVMSTDSITTSLLSVDSIASTPFPSSIESMIIGTPAFNSVVMTTSISDGELLDSFMSATAATVKDTIMNSSTYKYAESASIVTMMSVSAVMPTTTSTIATTTSGGSKDDSEPVIKMMIMSGESPMRVQEYGARLPDERGYADGIGRQQGGEDIDVKNIRFMYASVLVPVMSGLVGALLITFGILIFKCIKRKKLKRVRYYGAKPGSGLYRLDQIGLLSDMSSDEE